MEDRLGTEQKRVKKKIKNLFQKSRLHAGRHAHLQPKAVWPVEIESLGPELGSGGLPPAVPPDT